MRGFLDDLERTERRSSPSALSDFKDVLAQMGEHASERYFVLKSIVLNNLYGVDIMKEAVEICKLRLFLKLVAQLERYDQIEPLPDIDFNICAGNMLVGFTSLDAVRHSITMEPDGQHRALYGEDHETLERISDRAAIASLAFDEFRQQQTVLGGEVPAADKATLRSRLEDLNAELNRYLAAEYGIDPRDSASYAAWSVTHQPFHWFVEFYGISRVEGRRVTSRESVAHPALSHRAAVRVPWARFLPPLSEPGVPISGTGLSSGIMRLAHGLSGCDQRAGLASRGTRLTPWRWPAGASSDLLTP